MGKAKRILGGHWRGANRWYDAGYADAAPPSVTQVYLFLSRWADNETWTVQQTMGAIRRKSGVRQERTVREALRILKAWGVVSPLDEYPNRPTRWQLHDLQSRAPRCPKEAAKGDTSTPSSSAGVGEGQNQGRSADKMSHQTPSAPLQSTEVQSTGVASTGVLNDPPYQTAGYQTAGYQTGPIISSSGPEGPSDDANTVGENLSPVAFERATSPDRQEDWQVDSLREQLARARFAEDVHARLEKGIDHIAVSEGVKRQSLIAYWHHLFNTSPREAPSGHSESNGASEGASSNQGTPSQSDRRKLVKRLRDVLNGAGHNYVLEGDQAHRIFRGEPLQEVLTDSQLGEWEEYTVIPF
jgi:hypothetical protein